MVHWNKLSLLQLFQHFNSFHKWNCNIYDKRIPLIINDSFKSGNVIQKNTHKNASKIHFEESALAFYLFRIVFFFFFVADTQRWVSSFTTLIAITQSNFLSVALYKHNISLQSHITSIAELFSSFGSTLKNNDCRFGSFSSLHPFLRIRKPNPAPTSRLRLQI